MKPRIAVIGGGVFGLMCAARLGEAGFVVHLFERHRDLMQGASAWSNRLHMGYHYPRDDLTVAQCLLGHSRFRNEFEPAILENVRNAYFISNEDSATPPEEYIEFCHRNSLPYEVIDLDWYEPNITNVSLGIQTDEVIYNPDILRKLLVARLVKAGVQIRSGLRVVEIERKTDMTFSIFHGSRNSEPFDLIVNSSYARSSELDCVLGISKPDMQYELVRGAIIELDWRTCRSITIMDGPFFSLLPLGSHGRYLLIHVEKSVIFDSIGKFAPPEWFNIKESASRPADFHNWFADLIESCVRFVPSLQHARLIDVFEQPRMVLANKELTDERQSLVQAHDGYISVFSGKSDHSVWVADQVFDLVRAHLMHACDPSYLLDENTQK